MPRAASRASSSIPSISTKPARRPTRSRNFADWSQDEKITLAIGYTSSANCLAVAPVADELKTLLILHVCANYRLIDKGVYKYVFRTAAHAASENVAAALYVLATKPNLKSIAGMNYDYAYGRDAWDVFKRTILHHKPDVQVAGEL